MSKTKRAALTTVMIVWVARILVLFSGWVHHVECL